MYGIKVRLWYRWTSDETGTARYTELRNVTEIHYNYCRGCHGNVRRIAFESDIHGTGQTDSLDNVLEFETQVETEKAIAFNAE